MGIKDGKPCRKCGSFDYNSSGGCRPCKRDRYRKWREANPEKAREINRKWQKANPERNRDHSRKWREANPEKAREINRKWDGANPEKARERTRKWQKANPEKVKAIYHRRRTRKTKAGGSYTASQWRQICKKYNHHCLRCGQKFALSDLTVDHVKPVAMGGTSNPDNLQPLCLSCNSAKGAQFIDYRPKDANLRFWKQKKFEFI